MKKSLILFALLVSTLGFSYQRHAVTPKIGMDTGEFNFGADYKFMFAENVGVGGNFEFTGEKVKVGHVGLLAFAADVMVQFTKNGFKFYAAPGFGIINIDLGKESETAIGPSLRLGVLYSVSEMVSLGFNRSEFYNWSSDKISGGSIDNMSFAVQINF